MVPKGLQVGDTFWDGGRWFEVLAVNGNGTYSSRQIYNVVETVSAGGVEDAASYKADADKQETHSRAPAKRRTKKQ